MLCNFWYIACAASRLGSTPLATRVLDQELVLFRDDAGKPHALLNRCCHRGVQLSLGKVVNGAIACRYHGWRYDGSGRCKVCAGGPQAGHVRWPCRLYDYAIRARAARPEQASQRVP